MKWTSVPIVGGAYSDDTKPFSVQDCINYIPVIAEKEGTRGPSMLRGAPGMDLLLQLPSNSQIRGIYDVEGLFLAVCGNVLYKIYVNRAIKRLNNSFEVIGGIPGTGRVTFAHNQVSGGNQVAIANGQSGYVFDTRDDTLVQITDPSFPGFKSCIFFDGYILGVETGGNYFLNSDLTDALSYNQLDRQEAEKLPDKIRGIIATGNDIMIGGENTCQFFYNSGTLTGTFKNRSGAAIDIGWASTHCASVIDNTVYWLGNDGIVYRLNGYSPQRVSTHPIEQAISRNDISLAFSFIYEDRGHKIYYLTLPGGKTWGYDVATGEWHRRESKGIDRWRLSSLAKSGRNWIGGDYNNGQLFLINWDCNQEGGDELSRERVTGVLSDSGNRISINGIQLKFNVGIGDKCSFEEPISNLIITQIINIPIGGNYVYPLEVFDATGPVNFTEITGPTSAMGAVLLNTAGQWSISPSAVSPWSPAGSYNLQLQASDGATSSKINLRFDVA